MTYALYRFLLASGLICVSPYLVLKAIWNKKSRTRLLQRMGRLHRSQPGGQETVWVHAYSMGEMRAAQSLIHMLCERVPEHRVVLSTITDNAGVHPQIDLPGDIEIITFPFDLELFVGTALRSVSPSLVLMIEAELRPAFLRLCHRRGIPVILVNGCIPDRLLWCRASRRFLADIVSRFDLLLMQSRHDADRMVKLGARSAAVTVIGSLKYDLEMPDVRRTVDGLDQFFGLPASRLIVAGSTRWSEEGPLLEAFAALIRHPDTADVRLLIAPRYPCRNNRIESLIRRTGLSYVRRSRADDCPDPRSCQVILLDTVGELSAVYSLADIAFVGGSMVPLIGGHNILEPALFGVPIVVGPHTSNIRSVVEAFVHEGAIIQLTSPTRRPYAAQLVEVWHSLLQDSARRQMSGARARLILGRNRGATERTWAHVAPFLSGGGLDASLKH